MFCLARVESGGEGARSVGAESFRSNDTSFSDLSPLSLTA